MRLHNAGVELRLDDAGDVVLLLDAAGFERIIVETVGVGQAEIDIARTTHTTLVVEAPGMGDEVQAIKAGILEIADILVVNKADRPGVERTVAALEMALELGLEVVEGTWDLGRLEHAQEAMALSTVREIQPVSAIGLRRFYEGPVTADLARLFHQRAY